MNVRPRLLLIGKIPPPYYGPAVATQILLNSSLNKNFRISHFDSRLNDSAADIGKASLMKPLKIYLQHIEFKKRLVEFKPDLVVLPVSQSQLGFLKDEPFVRFAKRKDITILIHLRGSEIKDIVDSAKPRMKRFMINTIKSTDGAIVLGEKLRYLFFDWLPEEKIFVVPNGGNYEVPERSKTNSETLRLLYLSNLRESKGIKDVTDAISVLNSHKINYSLNVYGEWSEQKTREYCTTKIDVEALPVTIHPPISGQEKMQEMADSDIFLFPPNAPEGHPWVIIEAMASGLPIITTDQGAITESVIDGVNGFVVPPRDPAAIAEKILLLHKDQELRIRMGQASRQLYEQNFTEEKMISRLSHVFNTVLSR